MIKEDPQEQKYNLNVKEEDIKPQITQQEQGQLNFEQAANLMQYYPGGPQLVADDLYSAGDGDFLPSMSSGVYGTTSSGYASPMSSTYGSESQNGYFRAPYNQFDVGGGMNGLGGFAASSSDGIHGLSNSRPSGMSGSMSIPSSVPRSSPQNFQYLQHGLAYQQQPEEQGKLGTPFIVE